MTDTLKVLLIERDPVIFCALRRTLGSVAQRQGRKSEVLHAESIAEAKAIFTAHSDISGVVTSGTLNGGTKLHDGNRDEPDSEIVQFVGYVRELRPNLPVIAASNSSYCRTALVESGCTAECEKTEVVRVLMQLLKERS